MPPKHDRRSVELLPAIAERLDQRRRLNLTEPTRKVVAVDLVEPEQSKRKWLLVG
jgi:hypothetical protein